MSRLSAFRAALFDAVTHLFGYDCHVMRKGHSTSRSDNTRFEYLPAIGGWRISDGVEVWGFGFHVIASRIGGRSVGT